MPKNKDRTISITEARKRIFAIADDVQKPDFHYLLTERGRAKAVVLSAREYESLLETVEVAREIPALEKDIEQADKDIKSGAYKKYSTLDDVLKKAGYEKVRDLPGAKSKKRAK